MLQTAHLHSYLMPLLGADTICFGSFLANVESQTSSILNDTEAIAVKVALSCFESEIDTMDIEKINFISTSRLCHCSQNDIKGLKNKMLVKEALCLKQPILSAEERDGSKETLVSSDEFDQTFIHLLSVSNEKVNRVLSRAHHYFRVLEQEGKMSQSDKIKNCTMISQTAAITAICARLSFDNFPIQTQTIPQGVNVCKKLCMDLMKVKYQSPEISGQVTNICKVIGAMNREMSQKNPRELLSVICDQASKMTNRETIEQIEQHDRFFKLFDKKN